VLSVIAMTTIANQIHHLTQVGVDQPFEPATWCVPA
jgi:hypothetical protein